MAAKAPTPIDMTIGATIRTRRSARGLSQESLGEAVGVTFQQVQKYEKGTNRVSGSRLVAIAAALGCTVADLAGEMGGDATPLYPADVLRLAGRLAALPDDQRVHVVAALDRVVSALGLGERVIGVALQVAA